MFLLGSVAANRSSRSPAPSSWSRPRRMRVHWVEYYPRRNPTDSPMSSRHLARRGSRVNRCVPVLHRSSVSAIGSLIVAEILRVGVFAMRNRSRKNEAMELWEAKSLSSGLSQIRTNELIGSKAKQITVTRFLRKRERETRRDNGGEVISSRGIVGLVARRGHGWVCIGNKCDH